MGDALSEFQLIDRIVARLGEAAARDILVPPGDDAAAWRSSNGATVATTDALVEGTHWRSDTMSWGDVGWRAIASNVSDIAAMGAQPRFALLATVIGPALSIEDIDGLIDGVAASCLEHGVRVAGGDITRGPTTMLSVTLLGESTLDAGGTPLLLRRDGARAGDAVAVSGHPGAAASGLALIEAGRGSEDGLDALLEAHRRPVARTALGVAAVAAGLRCGIDVSDGLLQDAGHIAERSGAGIEIALDALPLHPAAVAVLGAKTARNLALGGGEDYELLLAGPHAVIDTLAMADVPLTVIGRVVEEHPREAWAIDAKGERYEPPSAGWDHLRAGTGATS